MDEGERKRGIERLAQDEREAADALLPVLYEELRDLAIVYMRRENVGHTLQPTALVHEIYLRLAGTEDRWVGREHFLAVAATAMRRVLINYARDRSRDKRGGGAARVTLDNLLDVLQSESVDVVALDDAMTRLSELSARQARVVELRVFGGLTVDETANVLELGPTTVKSEWSFARAWLKRELVDGN